MWPWEHAIVGYIAYSVFCHLVYRDSPTGVETIVVVFASVLPDIIDKPLAWEFGVFESGYALGHSIFFAVPLWIFVGLLTYAAGRPRLGWGFGIGYLLHLPADVIPIYFMRGEWQWERILWPVERTSGVPEDRGFVEQFFFLFDGYWAEVTSGDPSTYVWFQIGMTVFVVFLWMYDGAPVLREVLSGIRRVLLKRFETVSS